ncbi:MAG: hypothetical protein QXF28_03040 [Nitrososphaerota archaeon]
MNISKLLKRLIAVTIISVGVLVNWSTLSDYSAMIIAAFLAYILCELY